VDGDVPETRLSSMPSNGNPFPASLGQVSEQPKEANEVPAPPSGGPVNPFSFPRVPSDLRNPLLRDETQEHPPAQQTWPEWVYQVGGTATNAAWNGATGAFGAAGRLLTGLCNYAWGGRGAPVKAQPGPDAKPEIKANPFKATQTEDTDFTFRYRA
jgi:hypothetical protein